jgi:nucleoside-diphosphate-sugar epimerase
MEVKSKAGIIGSGQNKHSFICIDDVAAFHAAAVDIPEVKNSIMNLGGPQALSMLEVVQIFEKVLGKTRGKTHPGSDNENNVLYFKTIQPGGVQYYGFELCDCQNRIACNYGRADEAIWHSIDKR